MGFVFDPNDPEPDYLKAFLDDEDDFFDGADMDEEEDEDEGIAVERAPRRASSGPREDAGPRSRTTSMALGAGRFVDESGSFAFSGGCERGPIGRPAQLSPVARARVVELLEEAARGLSINRMRQLMRPGRRTKAASEDYSRLASATASLRGRRHIRVDHLAEVLGCDKATVWRLTVRGRAQLQDPRNPYVGTDAQQMAA